MNEDYNAIDLHKLIKRLLKNWWVLFLSVIIFSGAAYYFTQTMVTPIYRASSTIFIGREPGVSAALSMADITLGQKLTSDYRELIMSNLVIQEVYEGLPAKHKNVNIRGSLNVQIISDSRFMRIFFEDPNPERAMVVVNKVSEVLVVQAEEVVGVKNVQIVDYAQQPRYPVRPNLFNNVLIAGLLGLVLAILIILLKVLYSDTIQKKEDIELELGLPVLGVIPKF